jgi:hypothetical protein
VVGRVSVAMEYMVMVTILDIMMVERPEVGVPVRAI